MECFSLKSKTKPSRRNICWFLPWTLTCGFLETSLAAAPCGRTMGRSSGWCQRNYTWCYPKVQFWVFIFVKTMNQLQKEQHTPSHSISDSTQSLVDFIEKRLPGKKLLKNRVLKKKVSFQLLYLPSHEAS